MQHKKVTDSQSAGGKLPTNIAEAREQLDNGSIASVKLTQCYLDRIYSLDPQLNAFITIADKQAIEVASALDAELSAGKSRGVLHGIPLAIKDNFDTSGIKTTVGSEFFCDRVPSEDATIVQRLLKAGAVLLGKTNMTEFASSISGCNRFFGNPRNPRNLSHSAGGSSGGMAIAIAANMCLGGFGTDTGGSIRVPASWCGIVGIRPTVGLASLAGVYPRSSTIDVAGSMASCVSDAAILLDAIADLELAADLENLHQAVSSLRLGIIKNYTFRGVDPEVAQAIHSAINTFRKLGSEVVTIDVPWLADNLDFSAYFTIVLYEFYQILGEQYRAVKDKNIFSPIVRENLEKGSKISPKSYEQAMNQRRSHIAQFKEVFKECDALLTPTTPMVAPLLTANAKIFHNTRQFSIPFSFTGVPSISVPCGFNSQGLPIGLQIVGNHFQEALIIIIAAAFEGASHFCNQTVGAIAYSLRHGFANGQ